MDSYDIIIIGAGLSGVNSAYRLQTELPGHSFLILESRDSIGGTWGFWKYPGVRSDSAMGVFGLSWYPWPHDTNMGDAHLIRDYIEDAAASRGIDSKIRFGHRVAGMSWSSEEQRWTLSVTASGLDGLDGAGKREFSLSAKWVINCGGYYDYEKPLPVVIPGIEKFKGEVVHPQFWGDEIDHAGKEIVVIGSGATAVTLLPALAETAASVTILQRSPSYVFSLDGKDSTITLLRRWLPSRWASTINWWRTMISEIFFVSVLANFPNLGRMLIRYETKKQLPPGLDVDKHFNPRYNPLDQRLCLCPDGNFFEALRKPHCDIVTDTIETVTETGILTTSGRALKADMIVTATGLLMGLLGGLEVTIDGERVSERIAERYCWHSSMLEGIPNTGTVAGYTASTWTPGADAHVRMLIRVIKHMDRVGATSVVPFIDPERRKSFPQKPAVTNSSTYIVSAKDRLPIVADVGPWRNGKSWLADMWQLRFGSVTDGMKYTVPEGKAKGD